MGVVPPGANLLTVVLLELPLTTYRLLLPSTAKPRGLVTPVSVASGFRLPEVRAARLAARNLLTVLLTLLLMKRLPLPSKTSSSEPFCRLRLAAAASDP